MPVSGGGMRIKSIQRGVSQLGSGVSSLAITVSAVSTTKAELRKNGEYTNGSYPYEFLGTVILTNATTITATRGAASGMWWVSWELVEYY